MTVGGKVDSAIECMDDCRISRAEDRKRRSKKNSSSCEVRFGQLFLIER